MPLIVTAGSSATHELPPTGNTQAVCAFVEDVGTEHDEVNDKWTRKVVILWELSERMKDGRPFMLSRSYTLSLHEKATLRKDLESWRGKRFTDAELGGFDLEKLIGVNCLLNVVSYTKKNGEEGRKIAAVSPAMKGMNPLMPVTEKAPEWVAKRREENEKEFAASDKAPVVVLDDKPSKPSPVPAAVLDEPPF